MKTLYAACLSRLGLSQAEAAQLHGLGPNGLSTVKQWASGRRTPPQGIWDDLRAREAQIVDGSETFREVWEAARQPAIEIDDAETGGIALTAAADFLLNTPEGCEVYVGPTAATQLARQARRPN